MLYSQSIVQGEVMDGYGAFLHNTNILVKNTEKGTSSINGAFFVEADIGDTLVISHLGFRTQEIVVSNKAKRTVVFEVEKLDEILVTAHACKTVCLGRGCRSSKYLKCGAKGIPVTRLESVKNQLNPMLYPNPSPRGQFSLKFPKQYKAVRIIVSTITGKQVWSQATQMASSVLEIDLSGFSSGIYLVQVVADGQVLKTIKAIRG
jgi:hypothetical protein